MMRDPETRLNIKKSNACFPGNASQAKLSWEDHISDKINAKVWKVIVVCIIGSLGLICLLRGFLLSQRM